MWIGLFWENKIMISRIQCMQAKVNGAVRESARARLHYVLVQIPGGKVLRTSSRYTCVQITRSINCSRYLFVQIYNWHDSRAARTVWLQCIIQRNLKILGWMGSWRALFRCRLSPAQLHVLGFTAFRLCFGGVLMGAICSKTWFDWCTSWNCSSRHTTL